MKRFTLIELVVVVAILGILMSLLLPSVRDARKKSLGAVCANNHKNIGIAFTLYIETTQFQTISNSQWRQRVFTMLGEEQVEIRQKLSCPILSTPDKFNQNMNNEIQVDQPFVSQFTSPSATIVLGERSYAGEINHVDGDRIGPGQGTTSGRHFTKGYVWFIDGHVELGSHTKFINESNRPWYSWDR